MDAGEVRRAYKTIVSDQVVLKCSAADAVARIGQKYTPIISTGRPETDVSDTIDALLDQHEAAGHYDPTQFADPSLFTLDAVRLVVAKYSVISSPDALGWRIYYLRQMFHKSAKVLNTDGQAAFVNILGNIAFGRLPSVVVPFFSSWSFTILVAKETSAERYINAPSMLSRTAFSVCVALLDSSECLQELKPFQLAFGTLTGWF